MLEDARIYQVIFLSFFLLLGISTRDWTLQLQVVGVAIGTCLVTQIIAIRVQQHWNTNWNTGWMIEKVALPASELQPGTGLESGSISSPAARLPTFPVKSLLSPVITGLGLSLLLRVDHGTTMVLAGILAILSKFLLRVQGKHVFNPANFGIIAVLSLTQDSWVSPGQWGEESWYALVFVAAGGMVLQRVGRWDTSAVFLTGYAALEAIRNFWLGWTWDVWSHRMMSGSLLLFALFMITDPRTIPNHRLGRVIWALALAGLTFWLRNSCFITTAPFWALFLLSPLSILLDAIFPDDRFTWIDPDQKNPVKLLT